MRVKGFGWILMGCFCWMLVTGTQAWAGKFGPFQGKIVDAETKEPIEGAVVLIEWRLIHFFAGSTFFDAQETVTDKNGEFSIPGVTSINPLVLLKAEPGVFIYKSGYGTLSGHPIRGDWYALLEIEWGMPKGTYIWKLEEGKPVIMLKKLSLEERRRLDLPNPTGDIPHGKKRLFMQEINKERRFFGFGEVTD